MLPYILINLFSTTFYFIAQKLKNKYFYFITILLLVLFSGFRKNIGTDYRAYSELFYLAKVNKSFINTNQHIEIGFRYLLKILSKYGEFYLFTTVVALITISFIVMTIRYYENKYSYISIFLFTAIMSYYFQTFNLMRQALAVSILIYSSKYIIENKKINFLVILAIVALLFHRSAIIGVLFIVIDKIKFKKRYELIFLGISIIFSFFGKNMLENILKILPAYSFYSFYSQINMRWLEKDISLLNIINTIICIFIIQNKKKIINRKEVFLYKMVVSGIILKNATSFYSVLYRPFIYLDFFYFIGVILILKNKNRKFFILLIYFIYFMFYLKNLLFYKEYNIVNIFT